MRNSIVFFALLGLSAIVAADDLDLFASESSAGHHLFTRLNKARTLCSQSPFTSFEVKSFASGSLELEVSNDDGASRFAAQMVALPEGKWKIKTLSPDACSVSAAAASATTLLETEVDSEEQAPSAVSNVGGYKRIAVTDALVQRAAAHLKSQINQARGACSKGAYGKLEVSYAASDAGTVARTFQLELLGDGDRAHAYFATVRHDPAFLDEVKMNGAAKLWTTVSVVPAPCTSDEDEGLAYTFAEIEAHNANPSRTFEAKMYPQMIGTTQKAFPTGYIPMSIEDTPAGHIQYITSDDLQEAASNSSYDFRQVAPLCRATNEVLDQGYCGSCYAQATATSMGAALYRSSNTSINVKISAQDMADCSGSGCNGGHAITVYNAIMRTGVPEEYCDVDVAKNQQCGPKCTGGALWKPKNYVRIVAYDDAQSTREAKIRQALLTYGPLWIAFQVYNNFHAYSSGIYTVSAGATKSGGHAVTLIGWGEENGVKYWLCQNSWSARWGEKGYFRIRRGTDEAQIESWAIVAVIPDLRPSNLPPTCSDLCKNGGSIQTDCSCKCIGAFSGAQCQSCNVTSCQNGGVFNAGLCSCSCPAGFSGATCENFVARLNTNEVCKDGSGSPLSISWNKPSLVGSSCAVYRERAQLPIEQELCGSYTTWSGAKPRCNPTGTVAFSAKNLAALKSLTAGRYNIRCKEYLGVNEFGKPRGFGFMEGFAELASFNVKTSGCVRVSSVVVGSSGEEETSNNNNNNEQTPIVGGGKCALRGGTCATKKYCQGAYFANNWGCSDGNFCCIGRVVRADPTDENDDGCIARGGRCSALSSCTGNYLLNNLGCNNGLSCCLDATAPAHADTMLEESDHAAAADLDHGVLDSLFDE